MSNKLGRVSRAGFVVSHGLLMSAMGLGGCRAIRLRGVP